MLSVSRSLPLYPPICLYKIHTFTFMKVPALVCDLAVVSSLPKSRSSTGAAYSNRGRMNSLSNIFSLLLSPWFSSSSVLFLFLVSLSRSTLLFLNRLLFTCSDCYWLSFSTSAALLFICSLPLFPSIPILPFLFFLCLALQHHSPNHSAFLSPTSPPSHFYFLALSLQYSYFKCM